MSLDRRRFLEWAGSVGAGGFVLRSRAAEGDIRARSGQPRVTAEQLEVEAAKPVLTLRGLDQPLVIESIRLLKKQELSSNPDIR